jgi:hypothetical protein
MSSEPFAIPSREAKLLQAIHGLGLPSFRAVDLLEAFPKAFPNALEEFFGDGDAPNAVRVGIALKKLMGEQHDAFKLQGQKEEARLMMTSKYNKSLRTWRYRVIDKTAPVPVPAAAPAPEAPEAPPAKPAPPMVVKVTERAESIRVDSTGKIHREFYSQNPLNPHSSNAPVSVNPDMRTGVWERDSHGNYTKLGDRWLDGAAITGYPGGLHAGIDAMEQTAMMAGAPHAIRAMSHHQFMCLVLNCPEDSFC